MTGPKITRLYLDKLNLPEDASLSVRLVKLITAPVPEAITLARRLVEQTYREITQRQQQFQWLDWLETIVVYKLPALSREEIQRMMGLPDIDLKQTRFYQDVFAEGEAEGRQEGRQEEETNYPEIANTTLWFPGACSEKPNSSVDPRQN